MDLWPEAKAPQETGGAGGGGYLIQVADEPQPVVVKEEKGEEIQEMKVEQIDRLAVMPSGERAEATVELFYALKLCQFENERRGKESGQLAHLSVSQEELQLVLHEA